MKIESGRYYKTRSGKKAFVAAVENPFCECHYPIIGYLQSANCWSKWTSEGKNCNNFVLHPDDLIAEWKEPLTVTRWIALWSDGTMSSHTEPPRLPLSNLMAFKQVTITEGEGMQ